MLILCNGMIRSGSTLQYNLTRSLLEKLGLGRAEGWLASNVQEASRERLQRWAASARWHVTKTHRLPSCTAQLSACDTVRICYIHRDVRDVAVSAKRKWGYRDETLYAALAEAVDGYYAVRHLRPVLHQRYEAVVDDRTRAVAEIAEFLGVQASASTLKAVAAEQSIERAKARSATLAGSRSFRARVALLRLGRNLGLGSVARVLAACGLPVGRVRTLLSPWDRQTLQHADHISTNGGAIGQWRRELTVVERRTIQARFGQWLELENYNGLQFTTGGARGPLVEVA